MDIVAADAGPQDTASDLPSADPQPDSGPDHDPLLGYPPTGHQRLPGHLVFGEELRAFQSCGLPALTWVQLVLARGLPADHARLSLSRSRFGCWRKKR
jgi:hypothetical protein